MLRGLCRTTQRLELSDSELFYFVNGLRTAIKREVLLKTPKHYSEAFYIAKHVEAVDRITADEIVFSEFQESNNTNPEYHDFE